MWWKCSVAWISSLLVISWELLSCHYQWCGPYSTRVHRCCRPCSLLNSWTLTLSAGLNLALASLCRFLSPHSRHAYFPLQRRNLSVTEWLRWSMYRLIARETWAFLPRPGLAAGPAAWLAFRPQSSPWTSTGAACNRSVTSAGLFCIPMTSGSGIWDDCRLSSSSLY